MTVALILLVVLLAGGAMLYLHDRFTHGEEKAPVREPEQQCCGMHITCEKDSLLASVSPDVVYFDDEELDRFRGRGADEYSDAEIEEFRDVLLTLIPTDIAPWGRSLQLRGITLPAPVKEELLFIVAEARNAAI